MVQWSIGDLHLIQNLIYQGARKDAALDGSMWPNSIPGCKRLNCSSLSICGSIGGSVLYISYNNWMANLVLETNDDSTAARARRMDPIPSYETFKNLCKMILETYADNSCFIQQRADLSSCVLSATFWRGVGKESRHLNLLQKMNGWKHHE